MKAVWLRPDTGHGVGMITSTKAVFAAAALAVTTALSASAGAATVMASSVLDYDNPSLNEYMGSTTTTGTSTTARANLKNILGATDGKIYSIGERGFIVLGFASQFSGLATIVEVGAGGNSSTDREQAEVYVGNNVAALKSLALGDTSNSLSVGHIGSNATASINIPGAAWTYLLIKDTSFGGNSTYGIDIDSVRVTAVTEAQINAVAVPLPASVWGGMGMMGLLAAKRVRQKLAR